MCFQQRNSVCQRLVTGTSTKLQSNPHMRKIEQMRGFEMLKGCRCFVDAFRCLSFGYKSLRFLNLFYTDISTERFYIIRRFVMTDIHSDCTVWLIRVNLYLKSIYIQQNLLNINFFVILHIAFIHLAYCQSRTTLQGFCSQA